MLLTKAPEPEPLLVLVARATVGPVAVPHTTPLAVMGELPSAVMLPPDLALLNVISVTDTVVMLGTVAPAVVVNENSFPYPVPALLVA